MNKRFSCLVTGALTAILFAHGIAADELVLHDGSRVFGTVITKEGNTLEFKTSFAGSITVQWDKVSELKTEQPMQVLLSNDEIIRTDAIKNTDKSTTLDAGPDRSPLTFSPQEVPYLNPEPWRLGRGYKFSGHANFALKSDRGNTDKDDIDMDADVELRRQRDRFTLFGELEHDTSNNQTTKDKWKLRNRYDYFTSEKRYYSAILSMQADDLAELNLRAGLGPGLGYQFFESKEINLNAELGMLRVHESFNTQEDNNYWGAGWGINFDWFVLRDLLQFYHRQTGLWNLQDTSSVTMDTRTGLRIPLMLGLVASTEMKVAYDGGAAEEADTLDTTYRIKLGYQW
jgi:putative salt-induced outer membrane protein YdiY